MIKITKNTANTVDITLKEKQTLSNPYFIFRIWNDLRGIRKVFRAADTSSYLDRYNRFTITDNSIEDLTTGTVDFDVQGFWHYEVWESSVTTLSIEAATSLLESGKIQVLGASNVTWVEHTPNNSEWIVHNPS